MIVAFSSVSIQITYLRLKVSLPVDWTEWNLSKNQTNFLIHFLHNIQIRMNSSGDVNVFQWYKEWFFSRRVKFYSRLNVMTVCEVPDMDKKVICQFISIRRWVLIRWNRDSYILKESLCDFLLEFVDVIAMWMFSDPDLIQKIDSSICGWNINCPFSMGNIASFAWPFKSRFQIRPSFFTPQYQLSLCHPSKLPPRTIRIRETIQERLSFQLTDLSQKHVILNQFNKRNDWSFEKFSKTTFVWSFLIRQEILNISNMDIVFHGIYSPLFIQTRAVCLPLLCELLFQQSH